ncbi:hypothetical protein TWF730_001215 [Orbilia blumenaviensis]|uniref:Uncharacterized protein n=1 Tax=Orbilia blumenaviensis TaxID=1796055 RepID=A0AAV9VRK0_9PEZI
MSTPQPSSGGPPAEKDKSKRRSIQRFVSKIIKTTKTKKPETAEAAPAESSSASAPGPSTATPTVEETPVAKPADPKSDEVAAPAATETTAEPTIEPEDTSKTIPETSTAVAETSKTKPVLSLGARQLAEKHGIEIPEDWPYSVRPPAGERIEKPIRMRVRRYCHVCQTAFGSEKSCPSCNHKRCVDCPRSPPPKTDKKKKAKAKEYDPYEGLTMPSKTGGQPLVYRKIRQRVHWKCHKCESDFAGQKTCPKCTHNRCKKCHREPSRKPTPIEEIKRKKPAKWTCSECSAGANVTKTCASCSHPRCVDCVREVPKKKKKKAVLPPDFASESDTGAGQSDIENLNNALAAAVIS